MGVPTEQSRKKLRLVEPRHELTGKFPRGFEQAARSCVVGDSAHRALLFAGTTVARRAVAECMPPSLSQPVRRSLDQVDDWARDQVSLKALRAERAQLFEQRPQLEQATTQLIRSLAAEEPQSDFAQHAAGVVERYVALGVHHALSAALLCCDAATEPAVMLDLPAEVAAALAYRNTGLGPARSEELRRAAMHNAHWEATTVSASSKHGEPALLLQLWHEYLGVHWKNHVDAQRLYLEQFLEWAFGGSHTQERSHRH